MGNTCEQEGMFWKTSIGLVEITKGQVFLLSLKLCAQCGARTHEPEDQGSHPLPTKLDCFQVVSYLQGRRVHPQWDDLV